MIAASIAIAEVDPELATKTIKRSIDGMAYALFEYGLDGAYPEGAVYWGYGTMFSVVTAAIFESTLATDFGIADYPGFKESAIFRTLFSAPSGRLFNYTDCAEQPERYTEFTINWFATKTENRKFLSENKFSKTPTEIGKISRLAGAGIVWTAQFVEKETEDIPMAWKGDGTNPIVIFTGSENDPNGFYFSGKGGRGTVNHGNMDGGSFIFELNGVSWAIDPGNQSYGVLERAKFKLWGRCQECDRWELITKSNFGHSTLSVSNQLHVVDGLATIADFQKGDKPEVTIDMTATFQGQLKSAKRRFLKESSTSIIIEDNIEISEETKLITWQLITTADVIVVKGGAILKQNGKQFRLENLSHPDIVVSVISLDPAPLALDKQIEGLKRLEIRIPVWIIENDKTKISVRLSEG